MTRFLLASLPLLLAVGPAAAQRDVPPVPEMRFRVEALHAERVAGLLERLVSAHPGLLEAAYLDDGSIRLSLRRGEGISLRELERTVRAYAEALGDRTVALDRESVVLSGLVLLVFEGVHDPREARELRTRLAALERLSLRTDPISAKQIHVEVDPPDAGDAEPATPVLLGDVVRRVEGMFETTPEARPRLRDAIWTGPAVD